MPGFLKEKSLQGHAPGSPSFFALQKKLILSRPLMRRCYEDWYRRLLNDAKSAPYGTIVELGSGGGYYKDLEPDAVTSDVVENVADTVIDARQLPFKDESVRALVLIHVFHHIPNVERFFQEAQRALVPGGVISMIEITHTVFARFFFRNFHHEPYDDHQKEWAFTQQDSMMDSNQALSWIVFQRDRERFEQRFPGLRIELIEPMPWFTYFLSGGVTMRYLIPRWLEWPLIATERLLSPLHPLLSLYWQIRIRKLESGLRSKLPASEAQ
jgi:SAM-dependent methyltransferase